MLVPVELLIKFQSDDVTDGSHLKSLLQDTYEIGEQGVFSLFKNGKLVFDQDVALISQTIAHELDEAGTGELEHAFNVPAPPSTPPQTKVTKVPVSALKTNFSPGIQSQASVAHSAISSLTQNTHMVQKDDIIIKTNAKKTIMDMHEQTRLKDYKLPPVAEYEMDDSSDDDKAADVVIYDKYFKLGKTTTDKIPHIGVEALVEIEEKLYKLLKAKAVVESDVVIEDVPKIVDDTIPEPKFNKGDIVKITYKREQLYEVDDLKYMALYQTWSYGVVNSLRGAGGEKTYFDENRLRKQEATTPFIRESSKRIIDRLKKQEKQIEEVIKKAVTVKVYKDNMSTKSSDVKPNEKETRF